MHFDEMTIVKNRIYAFIPWYLNKFLFVKQCMRLYSNFQSNSLELMRVTIALLQLQIRFECNLYFAFNVYPSIYINKNQSIKNTMQMKLYVFLNNTFQEDH